MMRRLGTRWPNNPSDRATCHGRHNAGPRKEPWSRRFRLRLNCGGRWHLKPALELRAAMAYVIVRVRSVEGVRVNRGFDLNQTDFLNSKDQGLPGFFGREVKEFQTRLRI